MQLQNSTLSGINVTSTSEILTTAILVLLNVSYYGVKMAVWLLVA